jgi:hypothetical protein
MTVSQRTSSFVQHQGRYLLFLDILGFSDLVEGKGTDEIYEVINDALHAFSHWNDLNDRFRTISFSDTFILYQDLNGYASAYFLDVYAIGGMILSALLAKGIPARGAISFGEFEVRHDSSGKHQVFFGRALVEAYRAEQREHWIGITILKSAWSPYEQQNPGNIAAFEKEGVWIRRHDDVLALNPFNRLRTLYWDDLIGEIEKPYLEWNVPEFPNDILGFKFLREQATAYALNGDFSGAIAIKYHATIAFLKQVLGPEIYEWGIRISEPSA